MNTTLDSTTKHIVGYRVFIKDQETKHQDMIHAPVDGMH